MQTTEFTIPRAEILELVDQLLTEHKDRLVALYVVTTGKKGEYELTVTAESK